MKLYPYKLIMTKIKDILAIHVDDDIKSVIDLNQQDEKDVLDELLGFILTESFAKHLADFCDFYTSNTLQTGLWLSGFYGSGKSYFSKMIGFLLKNPVIMGTSFRDRFANKLIGLPDAVLLQNSINELGRTQNHVVLFDAAKATGNHGIAYMMMAAFLRSLGLNDDWVGVIEFNLLMSGRYSQFCDEVQKRYGHTWQTRRSNMDQVYDMLEEVMTGGGFCSQKAFDEMRDAAKARIADYDANRLQEDLRRYLDHDPDVRVVFMIDEVSEAITQGKINILDFEGVAEATSALGQRIWLIAIAQLQLDDVINSTNVNRNLLTKIIDRFRKRIPISAEEVDVIIRKRLLAKTAEGDQALQNYYKNNSGKITDITNIVGTGLKKTTEAKTYADYYPFYEHQFRMLQYFLFGTQKLVKTQVGTRGMLMSAFDVLRKESLSDRDIPAHVNAAQLCRQAEEAVPESLRVRYKQADEQLADMHLSFVIGHDLLQTIHFLTESGAKTTVENISRAYVNNPEDYFTVLDEVKRACKHLADKEILIFSSDEYRITSETQQRIFETMSKYDISAYRMKGEITKQVKSLHLVRQSQSATVGSAPVSFSLLSDSGEPLSTVGSDNLKVVFHDILSVKPSFSDYVEHVKDETQTEKDKISIIPTTEHTAEIQRIVEEILRIQYIRDVPNLTSEEKKVVDDIVSSLEDKTARLGQLVEESYVNGTLVYLYNTNILTSQNVVQTIKDAELRMYNNIYTKHLDSSLRDSLAMQLLKVTANQLQGVIGQEPDFLFFDTSGQFIGDKLPVVTEIMTQTASFKSGADLEKDLAAAPTGYSFGTVFSTLAALFRANKVIVKYSNQEFHSWQQDGACGPFANSRNFQKASFKAVTQNLTYAEKREIVDTLKDCDYKKLTGENVSYNMNDFELVESIRTLSQTEIGKVNNKICGKADLERIFHGSLAAADELRKYSGPVTEYNYFNTARNFLQKGNNDAFCYAVEKVEADVRFIDTNYSTIEEQKRYFAAVKAEMEFVGVPMLAYDQISEHYSQLLESAPVHNFQQMLDECQNLKDLYYQYMDDRARQMSTGYADLHTQLEAVRTKADQYPHDWNSELYSQIDAMEAECKRYAIGRVKLDDYSTRCSVSHLQLRDIVAAINMLPQRKVDVVVMGTSVKTSAPTPPPPPDDNNGNGGNGGKPQPTKRKLHDQLPTGTLSVDEYRQWLTRQLAMVNQYGATDILEFDE